MHFKTEILCKLLYAKPTLSARATHPPDWCTNMLYANICMHPSVANDLATHNNATFAKFNTCLLIQITDDIVKKITTKTVC
jgi:hypothetical protein